MKRLIALLVVAVWMLSCTPVLAKDGASLAPVPDVRGASAVVAGAQTGQVIYEKGSAQTQFPAGLTKLMTSVVAFENAGMDQLITIPDNIASYLSPLEPSTNLKPGEELTSGDLIKGVLVGSANDAAIALAIHCSGSVEQFVAQMNETAHALGMTATSFCNPTGAQDVNQVTTAQDMLLLYCHLLRSDELREIIESGAINVPATQLSQRRTYWTNNHMFSQRLATKYLYGPAKGGKATSSSAGGSSVITHARQNGIELVCVVLNSPQDQGIDYAMVDSKALLTYAYSNFLSVPVVKQGDMIYKTNAKSAAGDDNLLLCAKAPLNGLVLKTDKSSSIAKTLDLPKHCFAPIKQGDILGKATYTYQGKVVGTVDLVSANNISRNFVKHIFNSIFWLFSLPFAKVVLALMLAAIIVYAGLVANQINRKKSRRKNNRKKY